MQPTDLDDDYPDEEPPFIQPFSDQPPIPFACYVCFKPGPSADFCWSTDDDGLAAIICMPCVKARSDARIKTYKKTNQHDTRGDNPHGSPATT